MELPKRKPNRARGFDYNSDALYFITICTKDRKCILSSVVGCGALDAPQVKLTNIGKIVEKYIVSTNNIKNINVDKYIIMPNHIHMIIMVDNNGTPRASSPTNAVVPQAISALKRLASKELGQNIFQRSYHDRIIRDEEEYLKIWEYIEYNACKWQEDCYYVNEQT